MTTGVYSAGTAFLAVVPSFLHVEEAFRDELKKIGVKLDAQLAASANSALRNSAKSAAGHGKKAAHDFSGAFNKDIQRNLSKSLGDIPVWAGSSKSPWNRSMEQIRKDIHELSQEKIGLTIDENTAYRSIKNIRDRVKTLEGSAPKAAQFFNARSVGERLDSVMGTMEDARARGVQQAEVYGGAFDTHLKETLNKGAGNLRAIDVTIKADPSDAEKEIAEVREALLALSGKTIGVHVSSAEAMAELGRLEERLRALDNDTVDVQVRMDARTAANGLKEFQQNADGSADSVSKIEKAASLTMTRLQYLIALGASLGSVFVPGALAAAGAVGFIGTSAVAAGVGVGVLALGTSGLSEAVGALNQYSDQQAKSQVALDSSNRRVAGSTDAVAQATRSLGNTRRTVAEGAADAERAVEAAVLGVSRARHDAAISARDSSRQTADAQRDVTRAEAAAKDVRVDLNEAIRQARTEMQDLRTELTRNETDQQKAITEQMAALNQLNALKANPRATEVEIRRARDSYNEQTTRLLELADKRRELERERDEQQKKGIEGDAKVVKARERVAAADTAVGDARLKLKREQEDAAERALASDEKVADAQRRFGDAERAQIRQRLDGQYQIATAQSAVIQAARQQETALDQAGVAGGAALDNLNSAMARLTPTQQTFARFLFGLKDELDTLKAAAADPMLPGFQKAIEMLLPYLPGVASFIGRIAAQLGSMAVQSARALQGPVWQKFFTFIDQTAVPTMQLWAEAGGNIVEGLLNIYLALTPLNGQVGSGLLKLSEDFARWAAALDKSEGYQEFLEYVRENGPKVVEFLGDVGTLAVHLVKALMPMGSVMLGAVDGLVDLANAIPMPILTALVTVIGLMSLGISLLGATIRAGKFKRELGDIFGDTQRRYVERYADATGKAADDMGRFQTVVGTTAGAALTAKDRIVGMGSAMSGSYATAVQKYATDTGRAGTETGKFGTAVATAGGLAQAAGGKLKGFATSMGGLRGAASSLAGFLGGPWGIAITAASLIMVDFGNRSAAQQAKVDGLATALGVLNDEFNTLRDQGKLGSQAADEAFRQIIKSNPDLQKAVIQLDRLGVGFDEMMNSITTGDPATVMKAFNDEIMRLTSENIAERSKWGDFSFFAPEGKNVDKINELRAMADAWKKHAAEIGQSTAALQVFDEQSARHVGMAAIVKNNTGATSQELAGLATQWDRNQMKLDELNRTLGNFGDTSAAAARRADDLTAAIERQYGAAIKANESAETWSGSLLSLRESAEANGRTLDINSRAGLSNRDALEAAAQASRNMFIEEVRAGGKLPEVTKAHEGRIAALKAEADRTFGANSEAGKLIETYGKIDPSITTKYNTENFDQVFMQAQQLRFAQYLLEQGITDPEQAKSLWKQAMQDKQTAINLGGTPLAPWTMQEKATGGPIVGPGTGTSDDVAIWASNGEHMLTAAEVTAAGGHEAIYAFRKALMSGVHRHATGGPIGYGAQPAVRNGLPAYAGGGAIAPFKVDMSMTKLPSMAQAEDVIRRLGQLGGVGGVGSGGGMGWQWQFAALKKMFPNIVLYSGYRADSRTDSGALSWHSRDGGRAVDVTPLQEIFDYIHNTFGKQTKELIWGGDPSRNIYRGEHHRFSDSLLRRHGPYQGKAGPSPHIHWAYDQGGWLQPGAQQVVNLTRKPEPVLNQSQWAAIESQNDIMRQLVAKANQVGGGKGATYNFAFKDSTLDAARLRSMQQREDALARVGRQR